MCPFFWTHTVLFYNKVRPKMKKNEKEGNKEGNKVREVSYRWQKI